MKDKLTIVMYHYIRNLRETRYPEIKGLDSELFEEQIIYFKRNYNIVSMDDVLQSLESGLSLPDKSLLLTFDDGYKDHYAYAFPILVKHDVKGAFYIPTKSFEEKKVLDVNKIHFILATVENKEDIINAIYLLLDENRKKYCLKSNEYYFNKLGIESRFDTKEVIFIKRLLQVELVEELRGIIIDNLFKKYVSVDEETFWEELYLSKDQIQCMQKNGMHFGSHSYDHFWLNSLSEKKQEEQIQLSLESLKKIGVDITNWTMCYPYGGYNEDTLKILKKKGCKFAVTTKVDIGVLDRKTRLEMPRLDTNDLPKVRGAKINEWYINA